jgi:ParB family transcriptional regulator, chromosome partitioning protein
MELEWHQLDLRYEGLRRRHPAQERQLLASVAELGQQAPIIVINQSSPFVVIDGYKRVRILRRLGRDTIRSMGWSVSELEALLLERSLRQGSEDTLDQAWLLAELQLRFGLSLEELARRFERSKSWVSRRLALIQALPQTIQDQVRNGVLSAHAAMKYLVPLARANEQAARQLAEAIVPFEPSSRQVGALYQGWQSGTERTRELILSHPQVYLQAQASQVAAPVSPAQRWLQDVGALGGIARRVRRQLEKGLWTELLGAEREELSQAFERMRTEVGGLCHRFDLERDHVG